jgi:hypothetical protein
MLLLVNLFKQFWPFLLALLAVASVLGMLYSYGSNKYKAGFAAGDKGRIACEQSFAIEQASWVAQVQKQEKEYQELEKKKQEVITKYVTIYKEKLKEVAVNKKETTDEIKATIRPNDTVIVPTAFVSVYNHAVEGSRIATGDSNKKEVPNSSSGVIGKSAIFDATYFTEVVKGNVDAYNELAVRYTKLIEIVKEIEKLNE